MGLEEEYAKGESGPAQRYENDNGLDGVLSVVRLFYLLWKLFMKTVAMGITSGTNSTTFFPTSSGVHWMLQ